MDFTKEQLSDVFVKHIERGFQDLKEFMIESMMTTECRDFLDITGNKGHGFRQGKSYGQGRVLKFRIPRDRYGNFHPTKLTLLRGRRMLNQMRKYGFAAIA